MSRTYTEAERAEAVALGSAVGPLRAAKQLGIPRTTIAYWLHRPTSSAVIAQAEQDVATMLRTAHAQALGAVMAGLDDPKARLGDRAQALRVLGEQLALAEGRATANINQNINTQPYIEGWDDDERRALKEALDRELRRRRVVEQALTEEERRDLEALREMGDSDPDIALLLDVIDNKLAEEAARDVG